MHRIRRQALVPYGCQQMYELISDVQSYPRFLPWCSGAELVPIGDNEVRARLEMSRGPVRSAFTTRNRLEPPRRIEMELEDGPFRCLRGTWALVPVEGGGCDIRLHLDFEFANRLLEKALGKVFDQVLNSLVDAFVREAARRYG